MRISCPCIVWWKVKWSQQEMEVLLYRCLDRRCFWSWSVRQRQEFNMLQKLQFIVKEHKIIWADNLVPRTFSLAWGTLNQGKRSWERGWWAEWNKIQGAIAWIIIKLDERETQGRFEITYTIAPWIVRHEVQLLIDRAHFEIRKVFWGLLLSGRVSSAFHNF